MRTATICPTCATYTNSVCVIYDGPFLPTTGIEPGNSVEESIIKIESAIGGTNPVQKVEYSYTGQKSELQFTIVPPVKVQIGDNLYVGGPLAINCQPAIDYIYFYVTETSISFDNLNGILDDGYRQQIEIHSVNQLLESVNFPELIAANCGIQIYSNSLQSVSLPKAKALKWLYINGNVNTVELPEVEYMNSIGFGGSPEYINLPKLKYVERLSITESSLLSVELPLLEVASSPSFAFYISGCTSLTNLSLPSLRNIKSSTVILSNNAFNQSTVDGLLIKFASLDGTNGTTLFANKSVNLSGGTNATPSSAGLAAKAILQARGCTVTTN